MTTRQFGIPLFIADGEAQRLSRVGFSEFPFNEEWLQELLFQHGSILPIGEIEPVFDGLIPLGREIATKAGSIDLLFINSDGYLTIVETKLWRNPESRRKVVAQIIDYAKEIAKWDYEHLQSAIARFRKKENGSEDFDLFQHVVEDDRDEEEAYFVDRVQRNLRLGRFLLLIVGDGIREGVEEISNYLNQQNLQFTIGLVELAAFKLPAPPDAILVQPRILAHSVQLIHSIVEIRPLEHTANVVVTPEFSNPREAPHVAKSISNEDFFTELALKASEEEVRFVKNFLADGAENGLTIQWRRGGPRLSILHSASGIEFPVIKIDRRNIFDLFFPNREYKLAGLAPDHRSPFISSLAAAFPGGEANEGGSRVLINGKFPRIKDVITNWPSIMEAINQLKADINQGLG